MFYHHPITWCEQHGWTEPRQLENGLWVAFPPAGVMETPLPNQLDSRGINYKTNKMQAIFDVFLLSIVTIFTAIVALLMLPFWIAPLIKNFHSLKN